MPKFMDYHEKMPEMSPEQAQELMQGAKAQIESG